VADDGEFEKLRPGQLLKIWKEVGLERWKALLEENYPDSKWHVQGDDIIGCCPYHEEKTPSFYVRVGRGYACCYGANCKQYVWNPLEFLAKIWKAPIAKVLKELRRHFKIRLSKAYAQSLDQIEANEQLKHVLRRVMNLELCDALENPTASEFDYIEHAGLIPWLQKRNIPLGTIHQWPVGVLPTQSRLFQRLKEIDDGERWQGAAYEYLRDHFAMPGGAPKHEGWFAFFYYTSPTTIGRIKLRKPERDPADRSFVMVADSCDKNAGFFGLNMFAELRSVFADIPVYACEGDFDVLATVGHQLTAGRNDIFIIGTGGAQEDELDPLLAFGFKEIYAVPDNDAGGIGNVRGWMQASTGVKRVFIWAEDEKTRGIKDLDDAWRAYPFEDFFQRLRSDNSFVHAHEWAIQRTLEELDTVSEEDAPGRVAAVLKYAGMKNEADQSQFLDTICLTQRIDRALIAKEVMQDEDEEGVIKRLAKDLRKHFVFIAKETTERGKDTYARLWSLKERMLLTLPLSSAENTARTLEVNDLHDVTAYVRQTVGEPDCIEMKAFKRQLVPREYMEKQKLIRQLLQQAVTREICTCPDWKTLSKFGQGLHYPQHVNGDRAVYIVNGQHFYKGTITSTSEQVEYVSLDSPVIEGGVLQPSSRPWSQHLMTVDDVNSGKAYDPAEVFNKIYELLDAGWRFTNQKLDVMYLTADIMYTAIVSIFNEMPLTDISGQTHSGKTKLLHLIGGTQEHEIKLCEAALLCENYSAAGIRQIMDNNTFRLILDEFEERDLSGNRYDGKANSVREILELVRSVSTGSKYIRGTTEGRAIEGTVRFPLTVAGIYTMGQVRDVNRFVHIAMKHEPNRKDPSDVVRKKMTEADMQKLQRAVTLCLLPHISKILSIYNGEFSMENTMDVYGKTGEDVGSFTRLIGNVRPAATIIQFVGRDGKAFLREFCQQKASSLHASGMLVSDCERIWNTVLNTSITFTVPNQGPRTASLSRMIVDPDFQCMLQLSDYGVYYLPQKNWLVVHWPRLQTAALAKYSGAEWATIKKIADTHPRVIDASTISDDEKREVINSKIKGATFDGTYCSVFSLGNMLGRNENGIFVTTLEDAEKDKRIRQEQYEPAVNVPGNPGNPGKADI